jgi:hypothetical protein
VGIASCIPKIVNLLYQVLNGKDTFRHVFFDEKVRNFAESILKAKRSLCPASSRLWCPGIPGFWGIPNSRQNRFLRVGLNAGLSDPRVTAAATRAVVKAFAFWQRIVGFGLHLVVTMAATAAAPNKILKVVKLLDQGAVFQVTVNAQPITRVVAAVKREFKLIRRVVKPESKFVADQRMILAMLIATSLAKIVNLLHKVWNLKDTFCHVVFPQKRLIFVQSTFETRFA